MGRTRQTRRYGLEGPWVILLHGGPGAPGQMAPVARGLQDGFRVLEPMQRGSGGEPLTVERHLADLDEEIETVREGTRPALVGSSWGAMLALAYAAAHPDRAGKIVLVGCGTFDPEARSRIMPAIEERMDPARRARMARLDAEFPDPDARLDALGELLEPLYCFDAIPGALAGGACDARAHHETWEDMLRLQEEGVYPAAFAAIESPVLMLHGAYDPHPGALIRASLEPHLAQLEFHGWERCGHYPWAERAVREEFFSVLRAWLAGSP